MAKNLAYPNADHIALTADKEYKSGAPVRIGSICGVAVTDGKQGKRFTVHRNGSWRIPVVEKVEQGEPVYITTEGKLTKTKGTNKLFGVCLRGNTAANGDAEVHPAEIALD